MKASLGGTFSPLSILVDRIERGDFSIPDVPTESLLFKLLNTRDLGS